MTTTYAEPFNSIRESILSTIQLHKQTDTGSILLDRELAWYILMFSETVVIEGNVYLLGVRVHFTD